MQVIQHVDPAGHLIVARVPAEGSAAIQLGSQLIVEESQQAVMLRDGKALDNFVPGRHTLTTANLPLLTKLMGVPFGGKSPFQCAVLFVSTKTFLDLKWGTKEPVAYRDRELGLVRLRAFGKFAIRVADPRMFALQIVGTRDLYATDAIEAYLRDLIVSRLTDLLGEELDSILDLPGLYADLAAKLGERVDEDFARYGIVLEDLFVGAITPPKEVQEVIDEKAGMSVIGPDMATYLQFKAARAMGDAAQQEGGMGAGVGAGVGVGVGAGVGAMLPQMMKEAAAEQAQGSPGPAPVPATCPECGQALVGGARFCAFCGGSVA
jgi:membrane protease subunit (stomatin/prohibitin family)